MYVNMYVYTHRRRQHTRLYIHVITLYAIMPLMNRTDSDPQAFSKHSITILILQPYCCTI